MTFMASCRHDHAAEEQLSRIEDLLDSDSLSAATSLLEDVDKQADAFSTAQRMRYRLLQAEVMNKMYTDFTSDSVMTEVVAYYDRKGSADERMRAHYLLGCVYRDLNEVPRAVECYQNAIDLADTLSADCDFKTLSCIYSQMAYLFNQQLALTDAIESRQKSAHYSFLIGDTLNALYDLTQMTADYMMQGKNDSAEAIFMKAKAMYLQHGYKREWAIASLPLTHLYMLPPARLDDTKAILDLYKTALDEPTAPGTRPLPTRMYHQYRGRYYEAVGDLDSAELFFRKMYYPGMKYTHQDAMYHGLLDVFRKKGQVDSIVKYTLLYCLANDSSVATRDRELITQMHANYNYSRMQKEAYRQKEKATEAQNWMIFFIALAILLLFTATWILLFFHKRRRQKQQELEQTRRELEETKTAYEKEINELNLLEKTHKHVIELIQGELKSSLDESDMYRTQIQVSQHKIEEINRMHEESVQLHQEELERMRARIDDLRQKTGTTESLEAAKAFMESSIVRRVHHLAETSQYMLQDMEWETLVHEFRRCYPTLLSDLHQATSINNNGIRVCILVILKLRESDIAHFLNISSTSISNYKSDINLALFNDKSARTLFRNIERRYGILS